MGAATLPVVDGVLIDSTQMEVRLDEAFRLLNPPLSQAELASLEALLRVEGCQDALVVWLEEGLLLDGYNRHAICTRWNIPFRVRLKSLPDQEAARDWILRHQSGRRNLTSLGMAYLRGQRFDLLKGQAGGTGANQYRSAQRCQNDAAAHRKTAARLAEEFKVSARTIQRDAGFVHDVDLVAEERMEIKRLILSRDARLTRGDVMQLTKMERAEREEILEHLLKTGAVQRPWAKKAGQNLVLSRTPKVMVGQLLKRLGSKVANEVCRRLQRVLERRKSRRAAAAEPKQGEERN